MSLTTPIQVRLSLRQRRDLEAIAAARGITLSALIRERLDQTELMTSSLNSLRLTLALDEKRAPTPPMRPADGLSPELEAMLAEMLMTLRHAHKEPSRFAQGSLRQTALRIWEPDYRR